MQRTFFFLHGMEFNKLSNWGELLPFQIECCALCVLAFEINYAVRTPGLRPLICYSNNSVSWLEVSARVSVKRLKRLISGNLRASIQSRFNLASIIIIAIMHKHRTYELNQTWHYSGCQSNNESIYYKVASLNVYCSVFLNSHNACSASCCCCRRCLLEYW